MKGMLTRYQQILINFQRSHVVETTESGETSDDNIQKVFINYLGSPNPMDRLFAVAKVNNLLMPYAGDDFADPVDIRLVRGLYKRNTDLNDFVKR